MDQVTPAGQIVPVSPSLEERLQQLAQANLLSWSGRKLGSAPPATVLAQGSKMVAELLLEDRR